jgi:hypothetical protein
LARLNTVYGATLLCVVAHASAIFTALGCTPKDTPSAGATSSTSSEPSGSASGSEPSPGTDPVLSVLAQLSSADEHKVVSAAAALVHRCMDARVVSAVLSRAATLSLSDNGERFEVFSAMAQVLAYCDRDAEALLRGWLNANTGKRRAALRALAALAARSGQMSPETAVAVLRYPEFEETWFALSQPFKSTPSLRNKILEVAVEHYQKAPSYWVARALRKAEAGAVPLLQEFAANEQLDLAVRLAAVSSLRELGSAGQSALAELLTVGEQRLVLVALQALNSATVEAERPRLKKLLQAPTSPNNLEVHCLAAPMLRTKPAAECDLALGSAQQLTWLEAQSTFDNPDVAIPFEALLAAEDPRVVQQTLRLMSHQPERTAFDQALQAGLGHKNPGVVTTSADLLSALAKTFPARAPSQELVQALKRALLNPLNRKLTATQVALIDSARALQVLSLKRALPAFCSAPERAVRDATERALLELHAEGCPVPTTVAPPRLDAPNNAAKTNAPPDKIELVFEDQTLTIVVDPDLAPQVRAALRAFVEQGHFANTRVGAAKDGEWLRVGDPEGDAFPNGRVEPLVSQPSGKPFQRLSVALWQYGLDAASLELVVNLVDRPDLDADHTRVGEANGAWSTLRQGQLLKRAAWNP